jgi:hypothetical protein
MEINLQPLLIWVLYGNEWSDLRFGRFIPEHIIHCIRWIGPRSGLYMVAKNTAGYRRLIFKFLFMHFIFKRFV